jgi:hypothetical protein
MNPEKIVKLELTFGQKKMEKFIILKLLAIDVLLLNVLINIKLHGKE